MIEEENSGVYIKENIKTINKLIEEGSVSKGIQHVK